VLCHPADIFKRLSLAHCEHRTVSELKAEREGMKNEETEIEIDTGCV